MSSPPNPAENALETSLAPTERAAWDAVADACRAYEASATRAPAYYARLRDQEQAAWDAYRAALHAAREVAA